MVINPKSSLDHVSIYNGQLVDYSATSTSTYPDYMRFCGDYIAAGHDGLIPAQRKYSHYYFPDKTISAGGAIALGTVSYKLVCTEDLDKVKISCECEEVTLTSDDAELILNTNAQFKHIRGFLTYTSCDALTIYLGDNEYTIDLRNFNGATSSSLFEFEYIDKDLPDGQGLILVKYLKDCSTSAMQAQGGLWIPQSSITEFPVDYSLTLSSDLRSTSEQIRFIIFKYNY